MRWISSRRAAAAEAAEAPGGHGSGNRPGEAGIYQRGDVAQGFAAADVVFDEVYSTQTALDNSLEPHGCTALWEDGSLTAWESAQGVYQVRDELARHLDMPASRVRVISEYMGGGGGQRGVRRGRGADERDADQPCPPARRPGPDPRNGAMRPFDYVRAGNTAEALERNADGGELLAGGTDLVPLLDDGVLTPERLVDSRRAADLDGTIGVGDDGIRIGALTTLGDLLDHDGLARQAPLLLEAAAGAATPQIRSTATAAGNLLQRPRCRYFRNSHFRCWLAGGAACPAREGSNDLHAVFPAAEDNPCCAVHPSDLAPCLLALDAEVQVRDGADDERAVPFAELYREPTAERRAETVLGDELVIAVRWKRPAQRCRAPNR